MTAHALRLDADPVLVAVGTVTGMVDVSLDLEGAAGARLLRIAAAELLNRADDLDPMAPQR